MALRSAMQLATPLRAGLFHTLPKQASWTPLLKQNRPEAQRAMTTAVLQRPFAKDMGKQTALDRPTPQFMQHTGSFPALGGVRAMSSWRLRPYATAGASVVTPLSTLSAGFSKVGLSLLVLPWKALPMALVLAPACWMLPTFYRMIFTNSMRATTASAFSSLLALTVSFAPVPVFENLFSDFAFYSVALVTAFFTYMFFPELFLNDFMAMHFFVLFMIPLIPLAFTYMPMMHARTYLFL
jgi:hypothetical protein